LLLLLFGLRRWCRMGRSFALAAAAAAASVFAAARCAHLLGCVFNLGKLIPGPNGSSSRVKFRHKRDEYLQNTRTQGFSVV
jgi:hypothetical protein